MIDKKILDFIKEHHVLSLAFSHEDEIWSCSCFYTFLKTENAFLITSNENTKHIGLALKNSKVAGTIVLETTVVGKIQGLQFAGNIERVTKDNFLKYKLNYLKKFPFAVLMDSDLWIINLSELKYTDNRLGFGKKLLWFKNETEN